MRRKAKVYKVVNRTHKRDMPRRDFAQQQKGELTFCGVYHQYAEEIQKNWNENTRSTYQLDYEYYIFPELDEKPLKEYTKEDFDALLQTIIEKRKKENRSCSSETIAHYGHIIRRVLVAAENNGVCENVLWGSRNVHFSPKEKANEKKQLRRSLLTKEEIKIAKELLSDETQSGQKMGLALMFCLGLRNAEACGADFGNLMCFKEKPEAVFLAIGKTTKKGTNELKAGGKTLNFPRIVPVPQKLVALLEKRMEYIVKTREVTREEIADWPITCVQNDYKRRCSSENLTSAGTALFHHIKMKEQDYIDLEKDIAENRVEGAFHLEEKEATTYLFRRNFASHMYYLGLEEGEIQYLMGHDIEQKNESRLYFRNEEKLLELHRKMAKRPIVNEISENVFTLDDNVWLDLKNIEAVKLIAKSEAGQSKTYRITVTQREPGNPPEIKLNLIGDGKITGNYIIHSSSPNYSNTFNVLNEYTKLYEKKSNQVGSHQGREADVDDSAPDSAQEYNTDDDEQEQE